MAADGPGTTPTPAGSAPAPRGAAAAGGTPNRARPPPSAWPPPPAAPPGLPPAPAGGEVIETKDNWNYSRGLLFAWAIPYYHMGVRVGYSPNDKVTLTGFVLNGWNDVKDNNKDKTVAGSIAYKPNGKTTIIGNYIVG